MPTCSCGGTEIFVPETKDIKEHWKCDSCRSTKEIFTCKCGGVATLVVGNLKSHWSCNKCDRKGGLDIKEDYD